MDNYLFLTDPHIDYILSFKFKSILEKIKKFPIKAIFAAGDFANGNSGLKYLEILQKTTNFPIYYVLGNHDFWGSTFEKTEKLHSSNKNSNLNYLTSLEKPIRLNDNTCLIGENGWYDGGWGVNHYLLISSLDFLLIKNLSIFSSREEKLRAVENLARLSIERLSNKLHLALEEYDTVYLLTHVPPWPDETSVDWIDELWKPYNSCKLMAEFLQKVMANYPNKKLKIWAGHTHMDHYLVKGNIEMRVASASLGSINIDTIISI